MTGGTKKTSSWLAHHRPNPAATLRLFCFPYAGGGAHIYNHWSKNLPPQVEVCPVQLPGRANRLHERCFTRMGLLVEALASGISPYLDKPFAFFGHSMGAVIGFEVARLLRQKGVRPPAHLFVSGRSAPQLNHADPRTYDLCDEEFIAELRRLRGSPGEVLEHPELMQVLLPLLRADFELIQTYAYKDEPPLSSALTVLGGLEDDEVNSEGLGEWSVQTTGAFSLLMLPGDHFYLNTNQQLLLRRLSQEIYTSGLVA